MQTGRNDIKQRACTWTSSFCARSNRAKKSHSCADEDVKKHFSSLPPFSSLSYTLWYHNAFIRVGSQDFHCTTYRKRPPPSKCHFLPRNPFKKPNTSFYPLGTWTWNVACHPTFLRTQNEQMNALLFFPSSLDKVPAVLKVLGPFRPSNSELISYKCTAVDNKASTNKEIASSSI